MASYLIATDTSVVHLGDSALPYPALLGTALSPKLSESKVTVLGGSGILSVFLNSRIIQLNYPIYLSL